MARPTGIKTDPLQVRLSPEMQERVKLAAGRMGCSVSEAIRTATAIGLERLRRIDYDITGVVNDAAERLDVVSNIADIPTAIAAEEPGTYGNQKPDPDLAKKAAHLGKVAEKLNKAKAAEKKKQAARRKAA